MNMVNIKAGCDMIYLAGCAANFILPDRKRIEEMNLKEVYSASRFAGLLPLTWKAIEPVLQDPGCRIGLDPDILCRWEKACGRAALRERLFQLERARIYAFLEENGIWYLPLKGIVLKDFYPEPYLRTMVDNDILYDSGYQKQVRRWFLDQGYSVFQYKVGNADCYHKKPIYNFEMHTFLIGSLPGKQGRKYHETVEKRLILCEEGGCQYNFSNEDFYVYFILHMFKHGVRSGIGIRSLLDCYLYTKSKGGSLDWDYIHAELNRFMVADYERMVQTLSLKMFSEPEAFSMALFNAEEKACLEEFLDSNNHGTPEQIMKKELQSLGIEGENISGRAKLRCLIKHAFPDADYMASYASILARFQWMLPFGYIYRIARGLIRWPDKLWAELRALRKL